MGNGAGGTDRAYRDMIYEVLNGMVNNASTLADYRFYYYLKDGSL